MGKNAWPEAAWIVNQLKGSSGGGGGIAPSNLLGLTVAKDKNLAIKVRYTWPEDTVLEGQTIVSVGAVKVVIYESGQDTNDENGGIYSNISTIKNEYKVNPLIVNGSYFTEGQIYTMHIYPISDQGTVNRNPVNSYTWEASNVIKFGYRINKKDSNPATRVTYLEDCDNAEYDSAKMDYTSGTFNYGLWTDAWFIKDCKPCMLKYDGTVDYYLNPNNYSLKENGDASDVKNTSYQGNAMVEIPLVWVKTYTEGDYQYCIIADTQVDSTYHAYAHTDINGNIIDKIYMPIYNGANVSSRLRSMSGLTPMHTQTAETEINYAKANNLDSNNPIWYTEVLADRLLINHLLILIGKSTNTQAVFGNGYYTGGSNTSNPRMNTGTMDTKGLFWGSNGSTVLVGVKVFGMENWWGNAWRRIAGYINANGVQKIKLTYGKEDGSTTVGYNTTGAGYIALSGATPTGTSGGYISEAVMNEYGYFPVKASGSETTYDCDGLWFNNSQVSLAVVGGSCYNGFLDGALSVILNYTASDSNWAIGASISCKPTL